MTSPVTHPKKRQPLPQGWSWHWRGDKDVWEAVCPHGVGHDMGVHGCHLDEKTGKPCCLEVDVIRRRVGK